VTAVVPYSGWAQRRDLLVHPTTEQLSALPLSVLFVTDSMVQKEALTLPVRVPSTCAATCRGLSAASRPGAG
jgi:hypothetical protein